MSVEYFTNETVSISSSGKTTLPKQARHKLGVSEGDKVSFKIREDGEVVVEKAEEEE